MSMKPDHVRKEPVVVAVATAATGVPRVPAVVLVAGAPVVNRAGNKYN